MKQTKTLLQVRENNQKQAETQKVEGIHTCKKGFTLGNIRV